ncbi:MAG: ABC transporter permease [Ferruginibacter sp.]
MIKNYLKTAWRNLMKHTFISFINLFGLTVGITCCLLIIAYITNELSYDKFNANADRIYRVTRSFNTPDGVDVLHLSAVAPPAGPLLKNEFPDIEKMTRMIPNGNTAMKYSEKLFNENTAYFGDENFFDFFPVPVIKGNAKNALSEPFSLMLTPSMARKYFGDEDPMNKIIRIDRLFTYKVTGIFKDFPSNAHLHPQILLSFNSLKDTTVYGERQLETNWGNNSFYTYLMFPKNYPVQKIARQFPSFLDKYVRFPGPPPINRPSAGTKLFLQKLSAIHLTSHLDDEIEQNGDMNRVYIFSAIGLFILLIACINYMNLSTARSVLRAREVGIRKVVGAERKEIIGQFLSESILVACSALLMSLFLTWITLPLLNKISGQQLSINILLQWKIMIPLLLLPFAVGIISGIYPALFMSSFKPIQVLKGILKVGSVGVFFRKMLVVIQFSISIILIIATVIVFQQLRYMQKASLGYDRDHVINVPYNGALNPQFESFRNDLLKESTIKNLTRSSRVPTGRLLDASGTSVLSGDSMVPMQVNLKVISVDQEFIPTYNISFASGRNFSKEFLTDSVNYVINEAAVKILNWKSPQVAIGKDLAYNGVRGKVIGVCKDFHFESMHQKIVPLIMVYGTIANNRFNSLSVKVSGNNIAATVDKIQTAWYKYLPDAPFTYTFLDESYSRLYDAEQKQGTLFTIFACIAIFIACLGLFGLSAFSITQRIKEIGIRKVLGASVNSLLLLLSKDFLKLVLIAAIIAFPVAWFSMNKWLQDFAYRINIEWWVLAIAGIVAALIAFLTISFQATKTALSNPVKSLRTE